MTEYNLSAIAMRPFDYTATAVTMSTFHRTRHGDNNFIIDGEFYGFNFDTFDI
jgi:hypothetical protein